MRPSSAWPPFRTFYLVSVAQFAKSLASFSACSYILGIGDRHLDNFLFNNVSVPCDHTCKPSRSVASLNPLCCPGQTDGTLLGIDFGAAFGFGVVTLPIPELLPFR
jgi:DNA-dependent protein kinase catalytic subunit